MRTIAEQLHPTGCAFALRPDSDVAELRLLLPAELAVQLEQMARQHGLTIGQMLRRAIQALLTAEVSTLPPLSQQSEWHSDAKVKEDDL